MPAGFTRGERHDGSDGGGAVVARLSENDIEAYLASGEWRGKAGGYAAQGLAARGPELNAALYLLPLAATGLASAILADWPLVPASIRRLMSGPAGVPAE